MTMTLEDAMKYPDILTWVRDPENDIPNEMKWKDAASEQICFVRDRLMYLILPKAEHDFHVSRIKVVSTHHSKSIKLPVYFIYLKDILGINITLRHNFHDWKVSIDSRYPITCYIDDLITEERGPWADHYCEGFPKEMVYGMYKENHYKFTVEIHNHYELYTFFWLLSRFIKGHPQLFEIIK